jgi:hypothetical protein
LGEIINRARKLRAGVLAKARSDFGPSVIWENAYNSMILGAIDKMDDERQFIDYITGRNTFTCPTPTTDPAFRVVVDKYLAYFRGIGEPLESQPAEIQDSALVSDASTSTLDGRRISTMFLHHLAEVLRIRKFLPDLRKVIEIGGGFGGQARLTRLFYPRLTYVIVDLVNSLYCSYVYVSANFPDARILFMEDPAQAAEIDKFDFVFVPTEFIAALKGIKTDLIVNTASFGEMVQRDVDAFMQFINVDADTKYFYSVNRYARFENNMSLPDQAHTSVKLSADWEILFWDAFGERSFHQLDPVHPPQLELLARKVPREEQLTQSREMIAALLSVLASGLPRGGSDWHYCLWQAARLYPSRPLIADLIAGAEPDVFRDAAYYRQLAGTASPAAPRLSQGIDLAARPASSKPAAGGFRGKLADLIRG